ncbi:MAG: molybdopterin-dependent oxidoreductase [Rhodospirillaceae bacterium]
MIPVAQSSVTQTASHWGVYEVETDGNGRVIGTRPFAHDPEPPELIHGLQHMVHSPLRIDRPYVRAGYLRNPGAPGPHPRGAEPFVPVSWDTALSLVAGQLARVVADYGNTAVYGGSYGWASAGRLHHAPSVLKRFLGLCGGYVDKKGNHSFGAAMTIMPHVIGRADIPHLATSWKQVEENTELVVMFGGANTKNMQIDSGGAVLHGNLDGFRRARAAGVKFVSFSPCRRDLPEIVEPEWHMIRPGSDTAVMLAIAHTLIVGNLHDTAFLTRYCVGFDRLEAYVMGAADGVEKSPEWASRLSGVSADAIRQLARRMAASRTLVTTSWSIQRAHHGEQPVWMTTALAAMLGQIGRPGCGFALGFGATNGSLASKAPNVPKPTLPLGPNAVSDFCPAGRTNDLLLRPGMRMDYDGKSFVLPEIKLVYSAGGNPFHHNANTNRLVEAWQQPETIVVNEIWWNAAAKHADIVLPSTTTMERNDILASDEQKHWIAMKKAVAPHAQSRNDFDIFAELADRMGFREAFTENRTEMEWLRHMYEEARAAAQVAGYAPPAFSEFWEKGSCFFPTPDTDEILLGDYVRDPDANPLRTPSGKIEIASATVAGFDYADCPGHPTWIEPVEWLGSPLAERYPFHLISNQPVHRLHSQLDPAPASKASKIEGREPIEIARNDAERIGVAGGDVVRVFNDRGALLAGVRIVEDLAPGVAIMATGAWYDPLDPGTPGCLDKHGNPNVLTQDESSSRLGQATAAQTVLVGIERYDLPLPEITAFAAPDIQPMRDRH